ncbi:50S ribosomal protein L9 [Symmachiella dynata]|uniref:Large ribosomal subunit protein bL9 n=1 Tax=Symmachiella dynata TaxID=2527995 RepID=A0A517ZW15_9PLAN|nr:50S ribosomal protein L9 [Symmachiella dynata]QDT50979.1 50S ribosomal protein L9 [Symmachiella dynata]QDU46659.1 50S ribosomal protein L9 [Symmachiella dynata]
MSKKRLHAMRSGVPKGNAELLLAEDVPALGKQGEIVRVKSGYARNYLVPQGLATIATDENKRMVERHRVRLAELQKDRIKSIRNLAEQLSEYSVTLEANANPEGHLYGSITAPEISKALKAAKYDISPDQVRLEGPLKEIGMYTVKIHLHTDVETEVKVWVVPTSST